MWDQKELLVDGGVELAPDPSCTYVARPVTISISIILTALGKGSLGTINMSE